MRHNLGLKIVALLMALFIWLQITLVTQHESRTGLNLKLVNSTEADSLRQPPKKITCTVEGRGLDLLRLRFTSAYIQMEAADFWAGNALAYQVVDLPETMNVKVLGVIPPSPSEQARARDQAQHGEEHAPGGKMSSSGDDAEVARPDPGDQLQTRILSDLPIEAPRGLTVFPARATLKVRGPAAQLSKLPGQARVYLSTQADEHGLFNLDAELPEGVTLQDITPRQVRASQ